jgi:hypothetical protein
MEAESPGSAGTPGSSGVWKQWVKVAVIAAVLLLISEALWIWQTWPVRELLLPATLVRTR